MTTAPRDSADELKTLVYLLGHDVRNSVRALIEVPSWISEDLEASGEKLPGNIGEYVDIIGTNAKRVDKMISDLLRYAQITQADDVRLVELDRAVDDVLSKMQLPPEFVINRDLQCPHLMIGAGHLKVVLTELLENAVKHHPAAGGSIKIETKKTGDTFEMRVTDDGTGIAEAQRDLVFRPMKSMRPRDEVEGSGMGLSIARKIIEVYGGSLTIEDSPSGCTFKISIKDAQTT